MGSHTGYVSQGELMIENGQLVSGTVEVDMSTIEGDDHRSDNNLIKQLESLVRILVENASRRHQSRYAENF
jgi:hypothetical protein